MAVWVEHVGKRASANKVVRRTAILFDRPDLFDLLDDLLDLFDLLDVWRELSESHLNRQRWMEINTFAGRQFEELVPTIPVGSFWQPQADEAIAPADRKPYENRCELSVELNLRRSQSKTITKPLQEIFLFDIEKDRCT